MSQQGQNCCHAVQCAELAQKLAEDLASEGLKGRTVTLKLKTTAFEVRTRAATLTRHVSAYEDILREALRLLRLELPITIRLMVGAATLEVFCMLHLH
jgi:nucleotidyltransferase/DNA polymerase involved in DNA repair